MRTKAQAIEEITRCSGIQFDPSVCRLSSSGLRVLPHRIEFPYSELNPEPFSQLPAFIQIHSFKIDHRCLDIGYMLLRLAYKAYDLPECIFVYRLAQSIVGCLVLGIETY